MNVNSTSSVDSAKVTAVTKGAAGHSVKEGEAGDNEGFLSQLSALLFGSKASAEKGDSEAVASSEPAAAEKVAQAAHSEQSTDAVLKQSDADTESDAPEGGKQAGAEEAAIPENLQRFVADDGDETHATPSKTAQAMSDGDKLLGRLQQANQTLTKHNGKSLPHEHAANASAAVKVSGDKASPPSASAEDASFQPAAQASQELSDQQPLPVAHKTEPTNPAQAKEPGAMPLMAAPLLKAKQVQDGEAPGQPSGAGKAGKHLQVASDHEPAPLMAAAQAASVHGQPPLVHDVNPAAPTLPEVAAMAGMPSNAENIPVAVPAGQLLAANAPADVGEMDVAAQTPPVWHSQLAMAHHTLPPGQPSLIPPSQVQQAVAAQAPPLAGAEAAGPLLNQGTNPAQPNLVAAQLNPMLTPEMTGKAEAFNPAALKAALGAKGLGGIEELRGAHGSDGQLAHQVAAAAGQQGLNAPQTLRADQAPPQQSMPLHLSKEMGADEMAERVQVMMSKNLKHVDIRLDPPELGRLHIRMNMHGDGANVQFTVSNQQARDVLEHSMPRLREMLAQQGVQLADTSVQQQNSGQQQRYATGSGGQSGQTAGNEHFGSEENLDTDVKLDLNVAAKRDGISYYA